MQLRTFKTPDQRLDYYMMKIQTLPDGEEKERYIQVADNHCRFWGD